MSDRSISIASIALSFITIFLQYTFPSNAIIWSVFFTIAFIGLIWSFIREKSLGKWYLRLYNRKIVLSLLILLSISIFIWLITWQLLSNFNKEKTLLIPRIEALGAGGVPNNSDGFISFASLIVTIINNGPQTTAEHPQLSIKLSNDNTYEGALITIPSNGIEIDYLNNTSELLTRDEALDILLMKPIPNGGKVQGRLLFFFKDVNYKDLFELSTVAILSIKDGRGKKYSTPPFSPKKVEPGPNRDFPGLRLQDKNHKN